MTYEEARNRIRQKSEDMCAHDCGIKRGESEACDFCLDMEAFDMAIESLEREIPKMVKDKEKFKDAGIFPTVFIANCPSCGRTISSVLCDKWCDRCGQRLTWSEE